MSVDFASVKVVIKESYYYYYYYNPAVGDVVSVDCASRQTFQTDVFENDDARWQQVDRSLAIGVHKVDVGSVLQK